MTRDELRERVLREMVDAICDPQAQILPGDLPGADRIIALVRADERKRCAEELRVRACERGGGYGDIRVDHAIESELESLAEKWGSDTLGKERGTE